MSQFLQNFFDMGRTARFEAERAALQQRQPVQLPESTYNPTAQVYWRNGWNSPSLHEIEEFTQKSKHVPNPNKQKGVALLREQLQKQGGQPCHR